MPEEAFTGRCQPKQNLIRPGGAKFMSTRKADEKSFTLIFRRVADPVEPFRFVLFADDLPLPLPSRRFNGFEK